MSVKQPNNGVIYLHLKDRLIAYFAYRDTIADGDAWFGHVPDTRSEVTPKKEMWEKEKKKKKVYAKVLNDQTKGLE